MTSDNAIIYFNSENFKNIITDYMGCKCNTIASYSDIEHKAISILIVTDAEYLHCVTINLSNDIYIMYEYKNKTEYTQFEFSKYISELNRLDRFIKDKLLMVFADIYFDK